ncbi:chondroitinase-B domain-containing protein [Nonomuraea dietziae]|uniref:chondroitinase-B domain-containing protein n=1 Tax=Nonomuraea dietziae TaxID=65515 RepID=UPI003431B18A
MRRLLALCVLSTMLVAAPAHAEAQTLYEAEDATLVKAVVSNRSPGYSGSGFADYDSATGAYVEFAVPADAPAEVDLIFRYSNGSTVDRPLDVAVNGVKIATRPFSPSTDWATWRSTTVRATLKAGANTVRLTTTIANGPNLDKVTVRPVVEEPGGTVVTSMAALTEAIRTAQPGQRIVLANGTYAVDAAIPIAGKSGVTIAAQSVGGVTLTGSRTFTFNSSANVAVEGFVFKQRTGIVVPSNSTGIRIARNTFQLAEVDGAETHFLDVQGDDAEVANNLFAGKTEHGVFLQVGGATMPLRVAIRRNHFRDNTSTVNGSEGIRLGLGALGQVSARAVVEHNLFENVVGDDEVISVKASDSVVRHNTIRGGAKGVLTLRFGSRNTVEGNHIIGGDRGMRVYGAEHTIVNNHIQGVRRDGVYLGAGYDAIHDAAVRVKVLLNTVVNAGGAAISAQGGSNPATSPLVADNLFARASQGTLISLGNAVTPTVGGNLSWDTVSGTNPKLVQDANGILRLSSGSPAVNAAKGGYPAVSRDLDGQTRQGAADVGSDEYAPEIGPGPLTAAQVGPKAD